MIIRPATANDVPAISHVFRSLDFEKYKASDHAMIQKWLMKNKGVVAEVDNEIVGAMILELGEESGEIICIASTQKGTGRKLVEFAEEKCRSQKIPKLWCWSLTRYNAHGFYEKMEFAEQFLMKKQWFGEDSWVFGKVL